MASRFIKFGQTPIDEGVQELPIDILAGKAQDIQKQNDLAVQGYLKTFAPLQPGYGTVTQADYINKKIKQQAADLTESLMSPNSGGVDSVIPKLIKAKRDLQSDPNYTSVQADYKYRQDFEKQHKENVEKGNIPLYIDPTTGGVRQAPVGQAVNPAMYYGSVPFVDVNKLGNEAISKITPLLKEWAGEDVSGVKQNEQGDYFAVTSSGKTKKLDESVGHVKAALDAIPYELFNNPQTRNYFQEATNRGLIPDYAPQGDLYEKGRGYIQTLFPKYRQYETASKVGYDKLGNVIDLASKKKKLSPGEVLPLPNQLNNAPYTMKDFVTSAASSLTNRNSTWANAASTINSLPATVLSGAGVKKTPSGAVVEDDLSRIVKYASTVDPTTLSPQDRVALDNANKNAIQYFSAKRNLDFYTNQLKNPIESTYKELKHKYKNSPVKLKLIEESWKPVLDNPRAIIEGTAYLPIGQKELNNKIEKTAKLDLDNAYISLDSKAKGYSKTSYDLANNIWDSAGQKGVLFEGQPTDSDPSSGKAELFKKLTGSAPTGKLKPVGAAIDSYGRIGIVVEDEGSGNTAIFIKSAPLEYIPYIKKYYKDIATSDDYIARPVAYQGYFDTDLTERGIKSDFDNFVNSNHDTYINLGGLPITKTGGVYSYPTPKGLYTTTDIQSLKASLGQQLIK